MNTKNSRAKFLCNCVYGHALSCTERSVQACHGNAFGVRSRKQRRRKKKAGYLQSVALDFKLLGVGPELGTFGSRVQRSDHSTTPPRCKFASRRDVTRIVPQPISACRLWRQKKKKIRILRLAAFQARVIMWTEWSPIGSVFIQVITKSDEQTDIGRYEVQLTINPSIAISKENCEFSSNVWFRTQPTVRLHYQVFD